MKRCIMFLISLYVGLVGANAQVDNCDVNGDGVVNIADVTYVIDHILGKGHANAPTSEAGEAIDLGLPSGTKWASFNVGATKPEEYGGLYAWGETEEKSVYSLDNYKYFKDSKFVYIGDNICGTEYDVAHVKWGGNWRMPTIAETRELCDYCTIEGTTYNGVNGCLFTGPNGNSIFMPDAGYNWDVQGGLRNRGLYGYFWTGTWDTNDSDGINAYHMYFSSGVDFRVATWNMTSYRMIGLSIRPVIK